MDLANFGAFTITAILVSGLIAAQTAENLPRGLSAAELIHILAEPIDPVKHPELFDSNRIRISERNRAVASRLVALGPAAIPEIESAFDIIERQGRETPLTFNSRWLLFAYAKIRGPKAYERLRSMPDNAGLVSTDLDDSLALALGLTSYVSASRVARPSIGFQVEPRYSLDAMISAWMHGNRNEMEEELGPNARSSLKSLLAKRSWVGLEHQMWHGAARSDAAIGYRFEIPGDWSQPEETLDQGLWSRRYYINAHEFPAEPKLPTQFVDKTGSKCTKREIRFVQAPAGPRGMIFKYVVDDSDMEGLLRTISGCALHNP